MDATNLAPWPWPGCSTPTASSLRIAITPLGRPSATTGLIAGGHAYTSDRNKDGLTITVAKPSGGGVSEHLVVPYDFVDTELERHIIAQNHGKTYPQWGEKHSSYSYTMAFGRDCLLVRTTSRLYCFGR